jgi:hypothetical protein
VRRRRLKWGQTPFDNMSADELRRECQKMFSAVTSCRSALAMQRHNAPDHPYWGPDGTGGRALNKADAVIDPIEARYIDGSIYGSFFRYADDLLFPALIRDSGWYVCDCGCKTMVASVGTRQRPTNSIGSCKTPNDLRPLAWKDLEPLPSRKRPTEPEVTTSPE